MDIKFSFHAENQLKERLISKKIVEKVLTKPDQIVESQNNRKIAQKILNQGTYKFLYRVIYIIENRDYLVISAYKTTNIKKYWVKE